MSIIQELKDKALEMRKLRSDLSAVMQFHVSEVANIGKSAGNRDTTEDEAIQYLKKAVQKLKESLNSDTREISLLEELLPRMATQDEVRGYLQHLQTVENLDVSNRGTVMRAVKSHFGSCVDMRMVAGML